MEENNTIVSFKEIYKRYSKKEDYVIKDFSIDVMKGEVIGLIGESGCGKSTILRLLSGLEVPDSGEIYINNRKVFGNGVFVEPEKRNIGMVFQEYALFPHFTVEENISYGISKKKNKKSRVEELLRLIKMEAFGKRYPHELSGGQRQRVALARALAPEPDILLMDEPFNSLDKTIQEEIRGEVYSLIKKIGITVILVSHDTSDAFYMTDRVVLIKNGVNQQMGSPKDLYSSPSNSYVGQFFGKKNILSTSEEIHLNGNDELAFKNMMEHLIDVSKYNYILRPEDLEISDNGGISCKVMNHVHYGSHVEAWIKPVLGIKGHDINLLIYLDKSKEIENDTFITIKPKKSSIKKLINS